MVYALVYALPRMAIGQYGFSMNTIPTATPSSMSNAASSRTAVRARLLDPDGLIARIKAEYREMPGLSLTRVQAQRLWHLDEHTCRNVLARLVATGFLQITAKGHYTRPQ
jgi:hypothetical protein